mgnify:CR=1 FL=1
MKKSYKYILVMLVFLLFCSAALIKNNILASIPKSDIKYDEKDNSSVFPDSYKPYIQKLKSEHPNWNIKAFYTNLDWKHVIDSESSGTYSRIQDSAYSDVWKRVENKNDSNYNAAGYVLASRAAVEYVMDPRNFLNDKGIFQFRVVDQDIDSDTVEAVNQATMYTPMKDTDYPKTITDASKSVGISPLFTISRVKQETGCDIINNKSINGKHPSHPNYYNFFNIGAVDSNGAVQLGINYAYNMGWDTPYKAIAGGVEFLKNNYIKYGQNTVYFQKFDVANPYGNAVTILSWQYMSNIMAPKNEALIAYNGASNSNTLNNTYTFYIPIYNNMPEYAVSYPGDSNSSITEEYVDDNTVIYVNDIDAGYKLYVRSGPGTDYSVVAKLDNGAKMIRIAKSNNTQWDKVKLSDGTVGYVFRDYTIEYPQIREIKFEKDSYTINKGDKIKLEYILTQADARDKTLEWYTSDSNVALVDNGTVTAVGAGSTNITVKSTETGVSAVCKINVNSIKVESISLEKSEYTVVVGNSLTLIPTILPKEADNKNYTILSDDESIVKIENNKIVAVKVGEANVTFTTKENAKTVTAKIKVINIEEDTYVKFDSSIKVEENQITQVKINTKVSELNQKITVSNSNYKIIYKDISGNVISNENILGTGSTVNLATSSNEIIQTYTVIINGDVNGDSKLSAGDYVKIRNYFMGTSSLEGIFKKAADYDNNGDITAGDYVKIRNYIMSM